MNVLFQNSDFRLRRDADRLLLEQRGVLLLWIGMAFLIIAGAAFGGGPLARTMGWRLTGTETVALQVLGWVAGVGSVIMLGVGWRRHLHGASACFDFANGVLRVGQRTIGLAHIERVFLEHRTWAGADLVGVAVEVNGEEISLIPPQQDRHAAAMLTVLAQIHSAIDAAGHVVSDDVLPREDRTPRVDHTLAIALMVTGLLWSIAGAIFARTWLFALDDTNGLLVWPFGLWLLALGTLERCGVPVIETMMSGKMRYRAPLLLLIAGSYLLVCLQPLSG